MSATRRLAGRFLPLVIILALVIGVAAYFLVGKSKGYTVSLVFPSATNLNTGGLVEEAGFTVGHVKHLGVNNGQAVVEVDVSGANAPLHAGTSAAIDYKSLLGERYVELTPGPKGNPVVPSGGVISNSNGNITPRVELSSILSMLDPTTRTQLADLVPQFQQVFHGPNTQNTQATLQTAEPTVKALAQVLDAVGADGQNLHRLVTDMAGLSTRLVNKQTSLVSTVSGLDQAFGALSHQTTSLSAGINQLPGTLTQAQSTLNMVPQTTQLALPLLSDLKTATANLPTFASELSPVLTELQPVSAELVPTLNGLTNLLHYTPALVGSINTTVPQVTSAATQLEPAVNFLRPYSPELAGFFTDWGNWLAIYNATGHIGPLNATLGTTSVDVPALSALNLGSLATQIDPNRAPGALSGTPVMTDAAGNPVQ